MKVVLAVANLGIFQFLQASSEISKEQAFEILINKRNSKKSTVLTTNRRNLEEDLANPVENRPPASLSSSKQQRLWFASSTLEDDCGNHKCDLEEIFEHVGSKSEARKKLNRYKGVIRKIVFSCQKQSFLTAKMAILTFF